jgi:hypothetical protein
MICGPDGQSKSTAAALLVLMSTLENSPQPKVLAISKAHCLHSLR